MPRQRLVTWGTQASLALNFCCERNASDWQIGMKRYPTNFNISEKKVHTKMILSWVKWICLWKDSINNHGELWIVQNMDYYQLSFIFVARIILFLMEVNFHFWWKQLVWLWVLQAFGTFTCAIYYLLDYSLTVAILPIALAGAKGTVTRL